ncbi:MAG: leucine-rich repeat domain-containing protein [Salinivirgaceae bacterium]|nr:leucine-rich repeat domain-containing protein [Salinivirgaceae bacterium]
MDFNNYYYGYTAPTGDLIIPSDMGKYAVTRIETCAFRYCSNLTSVVIPISVTSIGESAFEYCSNLTIYCIIESQPSAWRYNWNKSNRPVFWGTKFEGDFAYRITNKELQEAEIIGYFGNDTVVKIPDRIAINADTTFKVTSIANDAFHYHTNIVTVTVPNTIINIGENAFCGCSSLSSINIPKSVTSIGTNAFSGCNNIKSLSYNTNAITTHFSGKTSIEKIIIGDSVTSIVASAFSGCAGLKEITIPESVKSIGANAFRNCSNLQSINIPNSVTSIGDYAFSSCKSLNSVNIPNSITTISQGAFYECVGLVSVSIPNSVTTIGKNAFALCSGLMAVNVPISVTTIAEAAFSGCSNLTSISIPISVSYIGDNAFKNCSKLYIYCVVESKPSGWSGNWNYSNCPVFWGAKLDGDFAYRVTNTALYEAEIIGYLGNNNNVKLPDEIAINAFSKCTVTGIGANAFKNRANLTSIIIPRTVKNIGNYAFNGCTGLTEVSAFGAVGNYAFGGCTGLVSVTVLGSGIGNNAFSNCSSLKNVIVAGSTQSIGDYAFANCYNLDSLVVKCPTPPNIYSNTFQSVDKNNPVFVPCGSVNSYKSASYWNNFVTFVDGEFPYAVVLNVENQTMGTATLKQKPSCDNSFAIIEAIGTNGFIFSHWNDGDTENPRTLTVTQDTVFTAFFEKNVTANISSSDNVRGYTSNKTIVFKYGETITVSAIANYGYHFTQWSDGVTANPRTITLTDDVEFQAQFGVNQYKITLKSNNSIMGNVSGGGTFNYNTTNTLTATAKPDYLFVNWSDGVTNNPRELLLTKDTAVTAIFVKEYNTLSATSANTSLGSVTGSGTIKYRETAAITATATAAHHHFVAWSDGNRQNPRTVQVVSDTVLVATFAIDSFTVAATSRTEEFGAVSGGGLYAYGTAVEVKAQPQPHCHFVEWSNGASGLVQQFDVKKDTAFNAAFAIDTHSLQATVADSTMGVATGSGTYDYGTAVTLTATAAAGCYFTGWSDGVTTNPRILTIGGDTVVVAQFGRLQEFGITVVPSDEARGTVVGTGRYQSGTEATLSATANEHYYFSQWSDGRTDNPRRIRVIADATYTAVFEPEQYSVTLSQNNADMGMVSGSGQYRYGDMVSCLAKPYQNYHFVQWSNGSTANPYEFVIESNQLLTAYFAAGAVTGIEDDAAAEPKIYAVGKTIIVENATNEILVYDAMGKLLCRDAIHRVRAEITVNGTGVYVIKVGNTVKRVAVESN